MATVLFNTDTQQVIGVFDPQYLVNGRPQAVELPLVELQITSPQQQVFNPATHNIQEAWTADLIAGTYNRAWQITEKSAQEKTDWINQQAAIQDEEIDMKSVKAILQTQIEARPDAAKLELKSIYNAWRVGIQVTVGQCYQHAGKLYKVLQGHTTQIDWQPDGTPALFVEIAPAGTIPEWKQPTGAHDAYKIGDKVTFQGKIYESLINGNTWSPTAYPAGWKEINK